MTTLSKNTFRPNLEGFEDRLVPATIGLTSAGVLTITGNDTSETIQLRQGNGVISIAGTNGGVRASAVRSVYVDARGGNDTVDLRTVLVPCTVSGGTGSDYIMGGENGDYLVGGDQNDIIFGMGGNDQLFGNGGNDRLLGGAGTNYLTGGTGTDFMDAGNPGYVANENDGSPDYIATMYAAGNSYSPEHVKQASQSYTCAFLATIAGMARAGVNMSAYITYRGYDNYGVGQYDVRMWNGRQWYAVRVAFAGGTDETDCRPTADYASWAIIMNRAWERVHGNRGGSPSEALFALGRASTTLYQNQMTTNTFAVIQNALARGYVVAGGTTSAPPNLENDHAFTVVQAVVSNGVRYVQLRNPWGMDGRGGNGPNDGYVWVTWNQFVANMYALIIG